jgi:7-cyano-7-deazaguanine synthase
MLELASDCRVLLSGGIDSAAGLVLALNRWSNVEALFIDYGQPPAARERAASAAVALHYDADWKSMKLEGVPVELGEIPGRNAALVHLGLLSWAPTAGVILMGIHAGTGYRDCEPEFVDVMQRSLDFHTGGSITLAAPFISFSKGDVYDYAIAQGVPLDLTYSCEAELKPCLVCPSCLDREALNARAH